MKKIILVIVIAAFVLPALAEEGANRLHFKVAGFSIQPLEAAPTEIGSQVLVMSLPPSEGFAPYVNIQIQPYSGSMDEYIKLSQEHFKTAGWTVISQGRPGKSSVLFEFKGFVQAQPMHWYARAERMAGRIYLATATATENQWSEEGEVLKRCVASFKCENGDKIAAPNAASSRR